MKDRKNKTNPRRTRNGLHKEGKTLFGCYVDPEIKALAILTSEKLRITFTDIIINGLKAEATRAGILVNGQVRKEFLENYNLCLELTKAKIDSRKGGTAK